MLSTEGSPPGDDWNSGEFGTMSGVHSPVNVSSVSPLGHAATDGPAVAGTVKAATAGAAAIAIANPPARISRRAENSRVAIVTLSVVLTDSTRNGLIASRIPLENTRRGAETSVDHWSKWCARAVSVSRLPGRCGVADRRRARNLRAAAGRRGSMTRTCSSFGALVGQPEGEAVQLSLADRTILVTGGAAVSARASRRPWWPPAAT